MNGIIIMYNLTCITNYNSIYSQLTVCTLSCTLPHKVNTLPLCNHDYVRDTDGYVKREQCTLEIIQNTIMNDEG